MDIYFNEEHMVNGLSLMHTTLFGMTTSVKERQPEKARSPILVTLLGMTTSAKEQHQANALSHIIPVPSLTE